MPLQPAVCGTAAAYTSAVLAPASVDVIDAEELYVVLSATSTPESFGCIVVEH
ncbi:hypothetical protein LCGC14_1611740, partial [marine sediment metagenome]